MNPLIARCLNSGMDGWHLVFSTCEEAVSICGHIVFIVTLASLSDLDLRTVRIRWPEICDFQKVALNVGVILNEG